MSLDIRPFLASDITDAYLEWLNDPEVTRFSNQRFRKHTRESCASYVGTFAGTRNEFLLLSDADGPVGTMTVYRTPQHGTADIGIMIGNRYKWGRGYGFTAWSAVLSRLLAEGTRKVTGGTARPNVAMVRIMQKAGMHLEGVREDQEIIDGEPADILYFARFGQ